MKEVDWNILRKIDQFSTDFSDYSYFNYPFTPDLKLYIDYSRSEKLFTIKYSIDQKVYMEIPRGQFSTQDEDPEKMCKRFYFNSNTSFKIVSNEGLERYFDISDRT